MIKLRGKQYRLPGGALGREFTSKYASVINSLAKGDQNSEASVCFVPLILQKHKNSGKGNLQLCSEPIRQCQLPVGNPFPEVSQGIF